ncbi:MAG: PQQ-binding-like beta-propeller repeat protein [Bythopirellula sp.]|nr:PQQ-binding-like beta-propeller repeat protein [Bythopirellula sp.]
MAIRFGHLRLLCVLMLALLCEVVSAEGPWPQWRGPNRDDISTETGLVQELPEGGPPRLWLFENCGSGYSGPAIVGNKLYILGARDKTDLLLCLDATTGEELWATPLGPMFENDWGDGPRATPTVDGELIFAMASNGNLVCAKTADGSVVWNKAMQDLGGKVPVWGYSESPLVLGEKLFCTPGEQQGAIAALDKQTGELLWQTEDLADVAHYSSIMPMQHDGKTILTQLLFKELVGVDPADGTVLWTVPFPGNVAVIPTPIVSQDMVFATAGYGAGCLAVKLSGQDAEVVYENKNMSNHHGGVILLDGHVYGHSDGKGWVCQNLESGEITWREREAFGKGAIGYADGRFYCLEEDTGQLALINASNKGWEEHGRFTLEPQTTIRKSKGKIWTHPVIADGKLYLRDQDLLHCFDVKAK